MTNESTTYEVGTIVHVAPTALLMERNIRTANTDKELVKSIKSVGVLEAVTAVLTENNQLLVRFGHRRTLAAVEVGCATIPVHITGTDSIDTTAEVTRVITQHDENTHRHGLSVAEEVGVVATLTGLGLSAAQVAKQARIKRADVDAALLVSESALARKATERYEALTLDQAAVVAEFEDEPETVKALVVAATEGKFEHVAQRARNDRHEAETTAALLATLEAEGVRIVERPAMLDRTKRLDDLKANPEATGPISGRDHAQCPGHVGWIGVEWIDIDAHGNPLEFPDEPDEEATEETWNVYEDECEALRRNYRRIRRHTSFYGCEDPDTHGHVDAYGRTLSPTPTPKDTTVSDEDRAAAKRARALVVENNKAWEAAESVRRDWLQQFATRKTPPKGTAAFLATALSRDSHVATANGANALAATWLGIKTVGYGNADLTPTKSTTENRALVIVLLQVLAAHEASNHKGAWRHNGTDSALGRYLRFIQAAGYTLSDVEKYAISKETA